MAKVFHEPLMEMHKFIEEKEFFKNENTLYLYLTNA